MIYVFYLHFLYLWYLISWREITFQGVFFFLKKDVERVKQQPENLKHVKEARENKDSGVSEAEEDGEETNRPRTERDSVYQDLDTETLYKRLQEVDPVYASRTHPNNRRKMLRY